MARVLPEWVRPGAEALLTWGLRDEHIERMSVTKITPTGQVVVTGNSRGERRFMLRDFLDDGTAHKYVNSGGFSMGSLDLYPMDHPKVPLLLAQQEHAQTWSRVDRAMTRLREAETGRIKGDSQQYADALIERLAAWKRAKENLSAFS